MGIIEHYWKVLKSDISLLLRESCSSAVLLETCYTLLRKLNVPVVQLDRARSS